MPDRRHPNVYWRGRGLLAFINLPISGFQRPACGVEFRSRGLTLLPGLTPLRLKSLSVVYALVPGRWAAEDVFSATASRMSAFNAFSSILSPSWKSMARLVLPSRLGLKRPEGSSNEAPRPWSLGGGPGELHTTRWRIVMSAAPESGARSAGRVTPPARFLVTRRNSEVINGLEADEYRADVVTLARPS